MLSQACLLLALGLVSAGPYQDALTRGTRDAAGQAITHLDIRDAILTLDMSIKAIANKMNRHEAREAQFADYVTKTMQALTGDHTLNERNMRTVAQMLAKLEERLQTVEEVVTQGAAAEAAALARIEVTLGEDAGGSAEVNEGGALREIKKVARKLNQVETKMDRGMGEVKTQISDTSDLLSGKISEVAEAVEASPSGGCSDVSRAEGSSTAVSSLVQQLQASVDASAASLSASLQQQETRLRQGIDALQEELKEAVQESSAHTSTVVDSLEAALKVHSEDIMSTLDDVASQSENIQNSVLENYEKLSTDIRGLKKVEQVMVNTADAVLDTKRSIEFGIQQIIFELGEVVKNSGHDINSTLYDQIHNVSYSILKNQTTALTNMTSMMEREIAQVWRQISVMYQSMAQSNNILDELSSTQREHMNASLSRVGDMDGTVGQINTKVADVEDNLNFLLGRLSLVVSEFNHMKSGVGDELTRLQQSLEAAAGQHRRGVAFGGAGQPGEEARYNVNKRHAVVEDEVAPTP